MRPSGGGDAEARGRERVVRWAAGVVVGAWASRGLGRGVKPLGQRRHFRRRTTPILVAPA